MKTNKIIHNICEYLEYVNNIKNNDSDIIAFRGQTNSRWNLESTLSHFTKKIKIDYPTSAEYELINQMVLRFPSEFPQTMSNFDMLSKMRHYGLPTRLIDFSLNSLVGLFFSCYDANEENKKEDGVVYVYKGNVCVTDDEVIEEICSSWRYNTKCGESELLDNSFINNPLFYNDSQKAFHYLSRTSNIKEYLFCVPKYYSEREKIQESIFLICQNDLKNAIKILKPKDYYDLYNACHDANDIRLKNISFAETLKPIDTNSDCFDLLIIPKECKESILKELNNAGINFGKLFPEMENVVKQIEYEYCIRYRKETTGNNKMGLDSIEEELSNELFSDIVIK